MSRRSLGVIAVIIVLLMAIVATAGLDNLPRQLRASVLAPRGELERPGTDTSPQEKSFHRDPLVCRLKPASSWRRY